MSPEEHQLATDRLPKHQETKAKRLQFSLVKDTVKKPSKLLQWLLSLMLTDWLDSFLDRRVDIHVSPHAVCRDPTELSTFKIPNPSALLDR